jgi:sterol desaturase/sphingolipid hydroxylase (fatty acid hydroxylase superfamily)
MDLTIAAVPGYFATMAAEAAWLRARAADQGPTPADYERRDTIASLTMGVGSLLAPIVAPKLLGPITPGKGKYGKALVYAVAVAAAVTTVADSIAHRIERDEHPADRADPDEPVASRERRRRWARVAKKVAGVGGTATIAGGVTALATAWNSRIKAEQVWKRRAHADLGEGAIAWAAAIIGWDFIYYWNHRFMHESRFLWAVHVVHHSSERYNLSTALRQPVADSLGPYLPYGALAFVGVRPRLIAQARAINLLYQYWIHTDTIRSLGSAEEVLNTPSHHRVHHGSNQQYLDRNHGSILIVWDRLFGTFEPEREPVIYGLTKNIESFSPIRIATHEHRDILRDVYHSDNWRDRLSFVVRGPGWAYRQHGEQSLAGA